MSTWTLSYTAPAGGDPTVQTFPEWGITAWSRTDRSQTTGTLTFDIPETITSASPFAYKGTIQILLDDAPVYTGVVTQAPRRVFSGGRHYLRFEIADPWWYLSQLIYQQGFNSFAGYDGEGDPILEEYFTTHVTLNHDANDAVCGTRTTLGDILDWAILKGVPIQYTLLDLPDMNILPRAEKDITCEQAIRAELALMDAYTWFDHTTSPPTFHCKRRADLTPVTLNTLDASKRISAADILPRYDLQVPYVRLIFEKTIDGFVATPVEDIYPDPLPDDHIGALISTITLAPFVSTTLSQELTTSAIAADSLDWWKANRKELADTEQYADLALIADSDSVKDLATGDASTLPNRVITGAIAPWMDAESAQVEISAKLSYRRKKTVGANAINLSKVSEQLVKIRATATDATTGTHTQTLVQSIGEDPADFVGLAQDIYTDLNVLSWDGTIEIIEAAYSGTIGIGNALNLSNGLAAWAAMNAGIQSRTEKMLENGGCVTTITIGPNKNLSPGEIVDLLRWNRTLNLYAGPLKRADAGMSAGTVSGPSRTPADNTTDSPPAVEEHIVNQAPDISGYSWALTQTSKDADDLPAIRMEQIDASTGAPVANTAKVTIKVADLVPDEGEDEMEAKFQPFTDSEGKTQYLFGTAVPTVGAGATKLALVTVWRDVLECTNEASETVWCLKSPKLRNTITSETLDGVAYTYTYEASYIVRTSTGGSPSTEETQVITPRFISGDTIWAYQIPATDSSKAVGQALVSATYVDANSDARAWTKEVST